MTSDPASTVCELAALRAGVAWADLPGRAVLLATGRDAVRFVDNFATAPLSRLNEGQGTESFFTDPRGWVIALANILRTDDGLWIDAAPGIATRLWEHLEHYHIREDVALVDASADRASVLIAGPLSADWIAARVAGAVPSRLFDHVRTRLGGVDVRLARMDWCGPDCFLVQMPTADESPFQRWLEAEDLPRADAADVECVRIVSGYPLPVDIPDKTLPQEIDRTARAISFTKGCYLGQETVARLDALGHVNRTLVLVAIEGPPPPAGSPVVCGDEVVGTITSSCPSPAGGEAVGLAILHRKALAGTLAVQGRTARVVDRPAGNAAVTLEGS
jgi:folate-binding protein YgfZ